MLSLNSFTLDFIGDKKGPPHIKFHASFNTLRRKKYTPILQFYVIASNDVIILSD